MRFRVNARWSPGSFYLTQRNHVTPAGGPERDDDLLQDFKSPVYELGGDVTQPLAGGAIKLVGLATRRKRDNWLERYRFRSEGGAGRARRLRAAPECPAQRDASCASTGPGQNLAGFSFETGVEGALNTLDHKVELFEFLAGGTPVQIDLPVDEAKVKEKRGRGLSSASGKQLSPAIRIDAGINYEYSNITVTGDTERRPHASDSGSRA